MAAARAVSGRMPKVPFGNWKRLSVLSALGIEGFLATMSVEDATDAAIFAAYLEQVLLPVLRQRKPDAVLVMDNLRSHKTPEVQAVLNPSFRLADTRKWRKSRKNGLNRAKNVAM